MASLPSPPWPSVMADVWLWGWPGRHRRLGGGDRGSGEAGDVLVLGGVAHHDGAAAGGKVDVEHVEVSDPAPEVLETVGLVAAWPVPAEPTSTGAPWW